MKKKKDLSDAKIESKLIEKYDLGFLIKQIREKGSRDPYWLSVNDVLRFLPKFQKAVSQIRKELHIVPEAVRNCLCSLCGTENFLRLTKVSKEIGRGINFPDPDDEIWKPISQAEKLIEDWKKKSYPTLPRKVTKMRLEILGNVPHTWQEAIEDYILFDKISTMPLIYRRGSPEVKTKVNNKTLEPYVEIRLYADTDISILKKLNWWKKTQRLLPAYCDPTEWSEHLMITRFLYYVLRKHIELPQKRALNWLKSNGLKFNLPDYQHSSQELRRFEGLFISPQK